MVPPATTRTTGLTFVTVAYEAELTMLEVQARSFERFVPAASVRSIYVLDNTRRGMTRRRRRRVSRLFGRHAPNLRFLHAPQLIGPTDAGGWHTQQLLKLAAASLLGDEHYVALDAKNHFVAEPSATFFLSPDGRARVSIGDARGARHLVQLERALDYCGLPREHTRWFPWPVTPFVLDAPRVRAMMHDIEVRSGRAFREEFLRQSLWEFWLYAAWVVRTEPMEAVFQTRTEEFLTIWPESDSSEAATVIAQADTGQTPVLGIHRAAYERFDHATVAELGSCWVGLGIFGARDDATRAVARIRAESLRQRRAERRRAFLRRARRTTGRTVRTAVDRSRSRPPT